jgi:hypothetical protein
VNVCKPLVGGRRRIVRRCGRGGGLRGVPHVRAPRGGPGGGGQPSRAVQVDPIKSTLKAPGTKRLKLKHDEVHTSFAFKINLRRYNLAAELEQAEEEEEDHARGRGLHSTTLQLKLSRFFVIYPAHRHKLSHKTCLR